MKKILATNLEDQTIVISEITAIVDLRNITVYEITNKTIEQIEELNTQIENVINQFIENWEEYELENVFQKMGLEYQIMDEYEEPRNCVVYYNNDLEFTNFIDFNTIDTYYHWDGSNWKYDELENVNYLEVSNEKISLDKFDGIRWKLNGNFCHSVVYKVITENEINVNDSYLLVVWSEYQNTEEEGKIVSINDIKDYIENNYYDLSDFIEEIENIKNL